MASSSGLPSRASSIYSRRSSTLHGHPYNHPTASTSSISLDSLPSNPALESTSTLINPPPPLSLIFDRNSVIDATLHSRAGPMYRIVTNSSVTRTDLCDLAEQRVVATIKRRELFPDVVIFAHRQGKSLRLKKWLKKQKLENGSPCVELLTERGHYIWRSDEAHRLALYDQDQTPIPRAYSRSVLDPPTIGLIVHPTSDHTRIEIITSFWSLNTGFE